MPENISEYADFIISTLLCMAVAARWILFDHPWVLVMIIILNIMAVLVYMADKKFAEGGMRRISERSLIFAAVLGTVGALAAMKIFRHKTKKKSFRIKLFAAIAVKILFILAMLFFFVQTQTEGF